MLSFGTIIALAYSYLKYYYIFYAHSNRLTFTKLSLIYFEIIVFLNILMQKKRQFLLN